jgi:hypothetical protein
MSDLQAAVAAAADAASAHSTAPALLIELVASLGRLAQTTDQATESGRRPFRIPYEWGEQLAELAWLVYLVADQTGVDLDPAVRNVADRVAREAAAARTRAAADQPDDSWF